MIVGFDAKRIVANATGLGSYGRNLVNALTAVPHDSHYFLFAPTPGNDRLRGEVNISPRVDFVYSPHRFRLLQDWWRRYGLARAAAQHSVQIFHGLSGELPVGLRRYGIKSVLTVHDLIFLRHPEYYKPVDVWLYKRKFYQSLREADRVVAISQCTKDDIVHYSNFPSERIDVLYQTCGRAFREQPTKEAVESIARFGLPQRFVLNVGTIEQRKNVAVAVEALAQLPEDVCLVIVGRATPYIKEVKARAAACGVSGRVRLLYDVTNDELPALYRAASAFVYPSRYEGFGIPVIEAIQSGLPVVAATGSCLEEAGGPDCLYASPDDAEQVAAYLRLCLSEEAHERVRRSQEYVRRFENGNVAEEMLQEYARVLRM